MSKPRCSKRSRVPRKPYDRDRLIDEMKMLGEYGLKNKTELWTFEKISDDAKKQARDLLISTNAQQLVVQGRTLLNRLVKLGIFSDVDFADVGDLKKNLSKVLDLTAKSFLERRLQQRVFGAGLAKSVHHARNLISNHHISVNGCVVNKPGFLVTAESEGHIEINKFSSLAGARLGRSKKRATSAEE